MKLKSLREEVFEANLEIVRRGLVIYTWGNASGLDRSRGIFAIKPSGAEKLGTWINAISPLLLIIGAVGLYIEFKTPGFGAPGIIGIGICQGRARHRAGKRAA